MKLPFDIENARKLDKSDPLAKFREKFIIQDDELIYLDGNSLGRLPKQSYDHLINVIREEWGTKLIRSWNEKWYELSSRLGTKISKMLGAEEGEVIVADSTSVNLFKLAYSALIFNEGKTKIVSDEMNFPSDLYILQGLVKMLGNKHSLLLAKSSDGIHIEKKQLENLLDDNTALLSLSHVAFKTSFMYNMESITKLAHKYGALCLWDLSHSFGSVPLNLKNAGVDMAIGCTYKYLNAGPGAPAFIFIRKELQEQLETPMWGWFGDDSPFDFSLNYKPAPGIRKFLTGTPPIISLSGIEPALDIIVAAGIDQIREKSIRQTNYFISLAHEFLIPLGFSLLSPIDSRDRGSHISICHPDAYRICKSLIDPEICEHVVLPDFREPNIIRIGIAPLYTRYSDIFIAVKQMSEIVKQEFYKRFSTLRESVT